MLGHFGAALLAGIILAADAPAPPPPIRSDWYARYQSIDDVAAKDLLDRAIGFGRNRLGAPAIPIRLVHLRRSVPLDEKASIRRGFQLTEIADSEKGVFAIYLSARPEDISFAGQLAHEAFHLFNARARDVYVEGLNMFLAEDFLVRSGLPWQPWLEHFRSGKEPLYGGAYFLVKDLARAAGSDAVCALLRFAVPTPANSERMEIDIDAWLDSLPGPTRDAARAAIEARYPAIEAIRAKDQPETAFRRPRPR